MSVQPHAGVARALAVSFVLCGLAGCGSPSTSSGTSAPSPLPEFTPSGVLPGSAKGVYPDRWTTPRVTFRVAVPGNARHVRVDLDVPAVYKPGEEGITLRLGHGAGQAKHGLPLGRQTLTFTVPSNVRGKSVDAELLPDATFNPAQIHMNSDQRQLGVWFYGVSFD